MEISSSENYVRTRQYDFWILRNTLILLWDSVLSTIFYIFLIFAPNNTIILLVKFFVAWFIVPSIHTAVASWFDMDISLKFPKCRGNGYLYLTIKKHFQNVPITVERVDLSVVGKIEIEMKRWFCRTTKLYITSNSSNHKGNELKERYFVCITSRNSAKRIKKELNHLLKSTDDLNIETEECYEEDDENDDDDDEKDEDEEKSEEKK
jgi:hypothetical protein